MQTHKVKGTVYDSSRIFPLEAVSVITSSGRGTITDAFGKYEIDVRENDSIWFSYLGKATMKYAIKDIQNIFQFDISLHVNIPVLKEVKVRPRSYRQDSLQNRQDYAKYFNYKKPGLSVAPAQYGAGIGFDLEALINMFRFRHHRNMLAFQKRLIIQEQEKYVDYRFSKALVRRLTSFEGERLDSFMRMYRPSYFFITTVNEYDFQLYIKEAAQQFLAGAKPEAFIRKKEEEILRRYKILPEEQDP
ncbi:MAG: hypothetical protein N2747_02000 [Chitinophagaceae bacterium]|nr:hypothetical protein [Chitinophagaceae bacterium]